MECSSRFKALKQLGSRFKAREVAIANATSRNGGAVGGNAIVPQIVKRLADRRSRILDFGAGKAAAHAAELERKGLDVTAYDFGANVVDGLHDPNALSRAYDMVYASNVLNVQSSPEMLNGTLGQMAKATRPGGQCIANYPGEPRKCSLDAEQVRAIAGKHFRNIEQIDGSESAPVWRMTR